MSYDYKQEHFIAAVKEVCANENVEVKQADSGMLYFVAKSSFLLSGDGKKCYRRIKKFINLQKLRQRLKMQKRQHKMHRIDCNVSKPKRTSWR